jgi:hypothetical protein
MNYKIFSRFSGVTIDEVLVGEWIYDHLYTLLGTTSYYSAIAHFYTLQITAAPAKPFPACCDFRSRSLASPSNRRNSSASRAHVITVLRITCN